MSELTLALGQEVSGITNPELLTSYLGHLQALSAGEVRESFSVGETRQPIDLRPMATSLDNLFIGLDNFAITGRPLRRNSTFRYENFTQTELDRYVSNRLVGLMVEVEPLCVDATSVQALFGSISIVPNVLNASMSHFRNSRIMGFASYPNGWSVLSVLTRRGFPSFTHFPRLVDIDGPRFQLTLREDKKRMDPKRFNRI